jgi:hypothetical protein
MSHCESALPHCMYILLSCLLCCSSSLLWSWAGALQAEWQVQGVPSWHIQQCHSKQPALLLMPQGHNHSSSWQQNLHRMQG